jgi:hypothetical protein
MKPEEPHPRQSYALSPLRDCGYGVHTSVSAVYLSRLGINSESHSESHLLED